MKLADAPSRHDANKVAPRGGARIETGRRTCTPSVRQVAPRGGARIETEVREEVEVDGQVAPRGGARIETEDPSCSTVKDPRRAPRGRAD